jgi:hypothetical protein
MLAEHFRVSATARWSVLGATKADLTIRASVAKAAGMIVKNGMAVARNLLEIQRVKAFCGEQP